MYEVLDRERGAPVALKLLRDADPAALYRFKREFRTLADLTHPNLVALDELFSDGTTGSSRWSWCTGSRSSSTCGPTALTARAVPLGMSEAAT